MTTRTFRLAGAALALGLTVTALSACGSSDDTSGSTSSGAIAALKGGGVNPLPPVTGQDAELAAIQRILAGDQALTIYKAIKPQAEDAAKEAILLANKAALGNTVDKEGVPATLLDPKVVTVDNIKDTVVADGFYTVDQICTAEYKDACAKAGLS